MWHAISTRLEVIAALRQRVAGGVPSLSRAAEAAASVRRGATGGHAIGVVQRVAVVGARRAEPAARAVRADARRPDERVQPVVPGARWQTGRTHAYAVSEAPGALGHGCAEAGAGAGRAERGQSKVSQRPLQIACTLPSLRG